MKKIVAGCALLALCLAASAMNVIRGRGFAVSGITGIDGMFEWNFPNTNVLAVDDGVTGTNLLNVFFQGNPTHIAASGRESAYYNYNNGLPEDLSDLYRPSYAGSAFDRHEGSMVFSYAFDIDDNLLHKPFRFVRGVDTMRTGIEFRFTFSGSDTLEILARTNQVEQFRLSMPNQWMDGLELMWQHVVYTYKGRHKLYWMGDDVTDQLTWVSSVDTNVWWDTVANSGVDPVNRWMVGASDGDVDALSAHLTELTHDEVQTLFWDWWITHGQSDWAYNNRSSWSNMIAQYTFDTPRGAQDFGFFKTNYIDTPAQAPVHLISSTSNGFYDFNTNGTGANQRFIRTYTGTVPGNFNTNRGTVMTWMYLRGTGGTGCTMLYVLNSGGGNSFRFGAEIGASQGFDDSMFLFISQGGANKLRMGCTNNWLNDKTNEWHHVAARQNGTEVELLLDGVRQATVTNVPQSPDTTAWMHTVYGGGADQLISGLGYIGSLDEIKIFNYALSDGEIAAIVAAESGMFTP